jgi:ATP-dependent helicase HrpB
LLFQRLLLKTAFFITPNLPCYAYLWRIQQMGKLYIPHYPVTEIAESLLVQLEQHHAVLLSAPPGAGKSTVLPLYLLEAPYLNGKKILMLEPRRLAARSVAARMADLLNEPLGKTVGYRIRFETCISDETRIEVVTEGILTRMLQNDPALEAYGIVIFDEFHERSIHADLGLALCREAQQLIRNDLRLLVMSATLELKGLQALLDAPVIESKGRQHPVEIKYLGASDYQSVAESAATHTVAVAEKHEGDILVFLPGEGEIKLAAERIKQSRPDWAVYPLFAQLQHHEQRRALLPDPSGRRRVVLATSIAETSLTIEGVHIVVDSGFMRKSRFSPTTGMSQLYTERVSVDSADQRAGRAGRLGPGVCYRMWSIADHERLASFRKPEILEADLCPLALELAAWGVSEPHTLTWIDPPPSGIYAGALETLQGINAVEGTKITAYGRDVHRLPCHPRVAHLLLSASNNDQKQLACDLAAVLEERDPLGKDAGVDINSRIELLRRYRGAQKLGKGFLRIAKTADSYLKLMGLEPNNGSFIPGETGLLLARMYPERIASAKPGNNALFQLANGRLASFAHTDSLAHEPWIAVAHLDQRETTGKIFMAAPLEPSDLAEFVKTNESVRWDSRNRQLVTATETRLGTLLLQSRPLAAPKPAWVKEALLQAVKQDGAVLLDWNSEVVNLQARVESLRKWNGAADYPSFNTEVLLAHAELWITPWLEKVRNAADFQKLPLLEALLAYLGWELQQKLNQLAPAFLIVPTGSKIKLEYYINGQTPVLAVRLQEMFGLTQTPTINQGIQPVVLHLLSPGYKPVQVTADLVSFWNGAYHEVKKELKRRYPKHAWPDDPFKALPVAKGRPMK